MADQAKVVDTERRLYVELPLTAISGKARLKRRSCFCHYGEPFAPSQVPMSLETYMEWQIGYDALAKDVENGKKSTSITNFSFSNYKNEKKYAYELSEVLYYAHKKGLITESDISKIYGQIKSVPEGMTFERMEDMSPYRTNPVSAEYNGLDFYKMHISYPLLIHRFGKYDIFAEVTITEKQKAIGTQAMLYVCIPVTSLEFDSLPLNRTVRPKEKARWVVGKEEAMLVLELFRIFGMLSPKHRHDVLAIFEMFFAEKVSGTVRQEKLL